MKVPTLCGGAWRGKWVARRSVGGYRYLSRRDEVVGVVVVGTRGRPGCPAGTPWVNEPGVSRPGVNQLRVNMPKMHMLKMHMPRVQMPRVQMPRVSTLRVSMLRVNVRRVKGLLRR
jgi:hypothetical protein